MEIFSENTPFFGALFGALFCAQLFASQSEKFAQNPFSERDPLTQGSVSGGFQAVVRGWSGEQIPSPHVDLNFASILPQFYPTFTSFLPLFKPCSAGNLEPQFGNHGLQTLG